MKIMQFSCIHCLVPLFFSFFNIFGFCLFFCKRLQTLLFPCLVKSLTLAFSPSYSLSGVVWGFVFSIFPEMDWIQLSNEVEWFSKTEILALFEVCPRPSCSLYCLLDCVSDKIVAALALRSQSFIYIVILGLLFGFFFPRSHHYYLEIIIAFFF